MLKTRTNSRNLRSVRPQWGMASLLLAMMVCGGFSGACNTSKHTSDSRLRGIDEMLDAELPKGTNVARVNLFLNERGYKVENPGQRSNRSGGGTQD